MLLPDLLFFPAIKKTKRSLGGRSIFDKEGGGKPDDAI